MAFLGRGAGPSSGSSHGGSNHYHHHHHNHNHYYDNYRNLDSRYEYFLTIVVEFIVLILFIALAFYTKESRLIEDPIRNVKENFLNVQYYGSLIILVVMFIINFLKDNPKRLFKIILGMLLINIVFITSVFFRKNCIR